MTFEHGPILPLSEAKSLVVRVSHSCPWNRCAFCAVYKGERFSLRPPDEVLADLDAMRAGSDDQPRSVLLYDADALLTPTDDLLRVLTGIRERFPYVHRITTYAQSTTLVRRPLDELRRLRAAGLDRVHVGMESGCDEVLSLVNKGASRALHIEGGRRAKAAGFELSEYLMPGLGGRALSEAHVRDSATALLEIQPDFVRLRSTIAVPGTPLADLQAGGGFVPLDDIETVGEIRQLLAGLSSLETRLESDHSLNLLMELRGDLPADRARLIELCDTLLEMPRHQQLRFVLARRAGWLTELAEIDDAGVSAAVDRALAELQARGTAPETVIARLRRNLV